MRRQQPANHQAEQDWFEPAISERELAATTSPSDPRLESSVAGHPSARVREGWRPSGPEDEERWYAEQARWERDGWLAARIGPSFMTVRRHPRVKLREVQHERSKQRALYVELGRRKTKRAAFRYARKLRDGYYGTGREKRPLRVFKRVARSGAEWWIVGARRKA